MVKSFFSILVSRLQDHHHPHICCHENLTIQENLHFHCQKWKEGAGQKKTSESHEFKLLLESNLPKLLTRPLTAQSEVAYHFVTVLTLLRVFFFWKIRYEKWPQTTVASKNFTKPTSMPPITALEPNKGCQWTQPKIVKPFSALNLDQCSQLIWPIAVRQKDFEPVQTCLKPVILDKSQEWSTTDLSLSSSSTLNISCGSSSVACGTWEVVQLLDSESWLRRSNCCWKQWKWKWTYILVQYVFSQESG